MLRENKLEIKLNNSSVALYLEFAFRYRQVCLIVYVYLLVGLRVLEQVTGLSTTFSQTLMRVKPGTNISPSPR